MLKLCVCALVAVACSHTYLVDREEYERFAQRPPAERHHDRVAAVRSEDGAAVWLDARAMSFRDSGSGWVLATGRATRAIQIAGGVILAVGLIATVAGAVAWAGAPSDDPVHLPPERAVGPFAAGLSLEASSALMLGLTEIARPEESYRVAP